ncbi:Nif3-like dinuclear metal center hexameric protein [Shewanella algae]|uniref:Nif3-like dinuclear metal center hexameric protein n=1 Tax=Shewanella algae TaxID=38313 RepID=UPI00118267EA|nr:Nif3-like dinuclear metal center hexameric protein [Shewanella algae]MBO2552817.1 Nif3-like dinuclear metal center hexameric protein [Shewanella algae]MBO2628996.1 Nif3-like dinuclear metal center hexameric protein [Shewanella algae]MCE9773366.1 Nif3-like dinuclear metal center hexameric protein [Shewanella algae]QTE93249.1 Nif3-like dinuclear metal center hexameric protein [Shewanella algae]TVK93374.1 Nif3-like dinuclear metal center hexameric protein [Shewanella algae]
MKREELRQYLHELLQLDKFRDYAPNGLQVEGKGEIRKIVTGVTACQALIDRTVEAGADALLVHHGFFWKNEPEVLTGMKQRRIKTLLLNDINLFGYHLPLDAHPVLGNNAELGRVLGVIEPEAVETVAQGLLWQGVLDSPMTAKDLSALLEQRLGQAPLHLDGGERNIQKLAWCTGGAQDYIDAAAALGVDAFISGEASERTFHSAVEQGIHYFGAGHHATERFGIKALGEHLAREFELEHEFIDIPNPV